MMPQKKALRQHYQQIRLAIPAHARRQGSLRIAAWLQQFAPYRAAQTVFVYVGLRDEVRTRPIMEAAWRDKKLVLIPLLVPGTRRMLAVPLWRWADLAPGDYNIPTVRNAQDYLQADALAQQPPGTVEGQAGMGPAAGDGAYSPPAPIDLALVPGLAFDHLGYRIGFGGGYYDRFLAAHAPRAIAGLCFEQQIAAAPLPREDTDIPMHALICPDGILHIGQEKTLCR